MDAEKLNPIILQLLEDGVPFVYGILLHSSAFIRQNKKSGNEEVFVLHEFHRKGIPGLIKWISTFPLDSDQIEIKGEEVVRYPTAPIGTATFLKMYSFCDWDGDLRINRGEPVFISQLGAGSVKFLENSGNAAKTDNL